MMFKNKNKVTTIKNSYKKCIILFFCLSLLSCNKKNTQEHISIADIHYKKARHFDKALQLDSAYFYYLRSADEHKKMKDSTLIVKSYFNLAKLDFYLNDYLRSEKNCVTALSYLPTKEETDHRLYIYNLLGLISKTSKKYDEAEKYFNKYRSRYLSKKDTLVFFIVYQNNLGNLYRERGDWEKSLTYYNNILRIPKIETKYPVKYARAINNKAKSLMNLRKDNEALPLLVKSLDIRKNSDDKPGLIMSFLSLSEFFADLNRTKSKEYALEALNICEKINDPTRKLEVFYLLAKIDSLNASEYFTVYKNLKDSLIQRERMFKDQTAKIRYETKEKEQQIAIKDKELSQKNRSLLIGSVLFVLTGIAALLFYRQNRKIQKQKEAIEYQKNRIEILQRELHHRMKNNLSVVDYFINMAKSNFPDQKYQTKLNELQNRMGSMFVIHKQLFNQKDITSVNARQYIKTLIDNIANTYQNKNIRVNLNIDKNENIGTNLSFPLGIIINEFVTNSYKHAFAKDEKGEISVSLKLENDVYKLVLQDNGKGLPQNFDISKLNSFGFESIELLVMEYGGNFDYNSKNGVKMFIEIPK